MQIKTEQMDLIVKEVLYRLGKIPKAIFIQGLCYSKQMHQACGYIQWLQVPSDLTQGMNLWIPSLSREQMMSVANGTPIDELSTWCLEGLLQGVSVHLFRQDLGFQPTAYEASPLLQKHIDALNLLTQSGLTVVEKPGEAKEVMHYQERLVSEKVARAWQRQSVKKVVIGAKTIITPLAADALREGEIKWCKE